MLLLDRRLLLAIPPLWRLGFRPFFLAGALFAALAIVLWLGALLGLLPGWQPLGGWLGWHRHEMLFGFVLAIIAGFLLTAVQNWTGRPGLSGKPLCALAMLWLAARLAWLLGAPWWLAVPVELAFPPALAWFIGLSLWQVRQVRNYPVLLVLLLLTLADALAMAGIASANETWLRSGVLAALWLVVALMSLIGGRVIPFFTQRGLGRSAQVAAWPWLDNALLLGTLGLAVLSAAGLTLQPTPAVAPLFGILGAGHLLRLWRWRDGDLWRVPLLWSLHLAYAWIALALLGLAGAAMGLGLAASLPLHALTVGGVGGLILAMIARVSLGHTGRALNPPAAMAWAFALLNLGVTARVFLVAWLPVAGLSLAALCWGAAFALFAWCYGPMLWRPRVDGQPG
ncbi:NnrS family protein [Pseudomonas panipatensis]|uniref:Uncharacterized protein involved in response to NO n=1 Tax=Pseudomonas panipatensis TaxID=428992 RepID=A0A1G8CYD7_9PSED|nr:NnrS family protein [Pseudomonas panipatensis]SDH50354.1 uncharacterized protein involved in response to NO [Pseudomonas panipatensis]SMP63156.1 uncharacterized protein involved in response to NO [Pseudomonas panipatensis]